MSDDEVVVLNVDDVVQEIANAARDILDRVIEESGKV